MKTLIIIILLLIALSVSSCSLTSLVNQGSSTEGIKPILVSSPQYNKQQKARARYKYKRIRRNAKAHH